MARLSTVVITLNAADRLAACLESISFADEVLVFDGGSVDRTIAIAEAAGAHVVRAPPWEGYGIQRQRAQALVKGDWILMIDSDERITPELAREIRDVVTINDVSTAYEIPRRTWVFGRYLSHSGWWPDYVLRLYPRDRGQYNAARVHERVQLSTGTGVQRLHAPLLHHTYKDLVDYLDKSRTYACAWADERAEAGQRASLANGIWHGLGCFLRMYLFKRGFLDGKPGLLLALLSAHSTFIKYAALWLHDHDQPPPEKTS